MPLRKVVFIANRFYHVYSRGNRKSQIFFEERDYLRFLEKLEEYRKRYLIDIIAFCLLSNHFHLLIRQKDKFPLPLFMGTLTNSYARYLSVKHHLPAGHVFQGRFGATAIDSEESFLQVSRYIHLNAIKEKILTLDFTSKGSKAIDRLYLIEKLQRYPYSSYQNYLSGKSGLVTINSEPIISLEKTKEKYRKFVESKISFDDLLVLESF